MSMLTAEQTAAVTSWIQAGAGLSEVQKRIREEFGISMTYLDARLLVDDLKLAIQDPEEEDDDDSLVGEPVANQSEAEPVPPPIPGGSVTVKIDQITKPQALVSGKVTFSDGQTAEWMLDQMGRLSLNPDTPGYRPTEADVMAFQTELQNAARSQGL